MDETGSGDPNDVLRDGMLPTARGHRRIRHEDFSQAPLSPMVAEEMPDPHEPVRVDPKRPPESPDVDATARTVRLRFLLGELPLFSVAFELCVLSTHFTRLGLKEHIKRLIRRRS